MKDDSSKIEKHILVVDDDPAIRDLIKEVVKRFGYSARTAADGYEALYFVEQKPFDLVITDIQMPGIDGLELIRRIKASHPEIDLIAITGHSAEYAYMDVITMGASDFITKPIDFHELQAKIVRVFRERGLFEELTRLSIRDELTDLYNRRYFQHRGSEEVARALRQRYPLFLILLDIDSFKSFNDSFGHQQGDELLRRLAEVIDDSIRNGVDISFRYGGDEFGVLAPQVSASQAFAIASRIRAKYNEIAGEGTSLSLGIAELLDGGEGFESDFETLVLHADEALYASKKEGRDRVTLYKSETE